jgi:hypothetical protein
VPFYGSSNIVAQLLRSLQGSLDPHQFQFTGCDLASRHAVVLGGGETSLMTCEHAPEDRPALFFGWACAAELTQIVATLKISHQRMSGEVAVKLADLKSRGLTTGIPGLELCCDYSLSPLGNLNEISIPEDDTDTNLNITTPSQRLFRLSRCVLLD